MVSFVPFGVVLVITYLFILRYVVETKGKTQEVRNARALTPPPR
jgi:hypothetical protein